MLFDTHCHLTNKRLFDNFEDLHKLLLLANDNGVKKFLTSGISYEDSLCAVNLASILDDVWVAIGFYSSSIPLIGKEHWEQLENLFQNLKVVAVGEIGLDFKSLGVVPKNIMEDVFINQLKLAKKFEKSVIIHCRGMVDELIVILEKHWDSMFERRMVFHCCEPDEKLLEFANKFKIYIGVDGDVTYDLRKMAFVNKIPLELLVLETDSPFLLPEPLKSQGIYPNVPANLVFIAEEVSRLKGIQLNELEQICWKNSLNLFNLKG